MNKDQIKEFLNQVLGKRINRSNWDSCTYFVPHNIIYYVGIPHLIGKMNDNSLKEYKVSDGFCPDFSGEYWEYYDSTKPLYQDFELEFTTYCNHEWKAVKLVMSDVYDCVKCGMKKEDYDGGSK